MIKEHETLIGTVSIFLSSIGLIIAAASAWFAWQQVEIISKDRKTAFDAVLYQEQLQSRRELLDAFARYEDSARCVESSFVTEKSFGPDIENRRRCLDRMTEPFNELEAVTRSSASVWKRKSRDLIISYTLDAARLNLCAGYILIDRSQLVNGIPQLECAGRFKANATKLTQKGNDANNAMLEDLRATAGSPK